MFSATLLESKKTQRKKDTVIAGEIKKNSNLHRLVRKRLTRKSVSAQAEQSVLLLRRADPHGVHGLVTDTSVLEQGQSSPRAGVGNALGVVA